MRLTKKHIRQMILREMRELNEIGEMGMSTAYVPSPQQQAAMRAQMVQEFMDIRVPGIPGAIYSQVEAEAMADKKIAELNAPMAGAGMSTSYGAPRAGRIVREMRMGHPADMPPGVTGYFEPEDPTDAPMPGMGMPAQGTYPHLDRMALEQELASHGLQNLPPEMSDEKLASLLQALGGPVMLQEKRTRRHILREMEESPPAAVIANEVEQIADQGLLTKIWNMIKQTVDPPPMTPEEKARAQEEFSAMLRARREAMANPQTMGDKFNKWLSGAPESAFDDISTISETRRTRRHLLREIEMPPSASVVADAVEQVQDPGLLARIWELIKAVGAGVADELNSMDPEQIAALMSPDPMAAAYGLAAAEHMKQSRDPGSLSEGFEPGGYRAEGDRKVSEVSIGVSRWNILAGTEK